MTPITEGAKLTLPSEDEMAAMLLDADEGWDEASGPFDLAWARDNIKAGDGKAHSGDCTKQPWSCLRCITDEYRGKARHILAALSTPSMKEEERD